MLIFPAKETEPTNIYQVADDGAQTVSVFSHM